MRLEARDHRSLALWATECAEHVLPYFDEEYPKHDRPRKAVEAGRAWARGEVKMSEARAAAAAAHAARDASRAAARAERGRGLGSPRLVPLCLAATRNGYCNS